MSCVKYLKLKRRISGVNGAFKYNYLGKWAPVFWFELVSRNLVYIVAKKIIHVLNKFLLQKIVDSVFKHLLDIRIFCNPSSKLMVIKAIPGLNMI